MNPKHLVWLDLETTGLDPQKDQVLEVCAYIAPFSDPFNAERFYHAVLQCTDMSSVDDHVLEMHAKSGLWSECICSKLSEKAVDEQLMDRLIDRFQPSLEKYGLVLAGFSAHFDLSFIRARFPQVSRFFSHRVYDVSAVKLFCRSLGMLESMTPKQEAHRAEADVLESIEHAKICRVWLETRQVLHQIARLS